MNRICQNCGGDLSERDSAAHRYGVREYECEDCPAVGGISMRSRTRHGPALLESDDARMLWTDTGVSEVPVK